MNMDEGAFWTLIDRARGARLGMGSPRRASADPERLHACLEKEPDEVVKGFGHEFARQMGRLNRWSVWGAAYMINGGASDDGFLYFCEWLVGKGRAAVEQALDEPDGLGKFVETDEAENEGLGAVAFDLLANRGVATEASVYPGVPPEGEPFDEGTVSEAYPRLAARFG